MKLRIFQLCDHIHTLGPGTRFGLWVQGCERRCSGCISPEGQSLEGGVLTDTNELAQRIASLGDIEGITVSGGEPLLQSEALCELLSLLRPSELGVILYTGYRYEEIASDPLMQYCDAVIDGEYIPAFDDGRSMRGSSNQRMICLTDRYSGFPFGAEGRETELVSTDNNSLALVGIPSAESVMYADYIGSTMKGR